MNNITPLNANREQIKKMKNLYSSHHPSFKGGLPPTIISQADRTVMDIFKQHYGTIGERVGEKVGKLVTESQILNKSSRFVLKEGITSIKDKRTGRAVIENLIFPFVNLPLYAASWVTKRAQSLPVIGSKAQKLYKSSVLRIPRKLNELDEKTDIIKGMYDKTSEIVKEFAKKRGINAEYLFQQLNKTDDNPQAKELVKEATEYIKENLYKTSNKFFDKNTGNFNTAYERPLNRIITGLIPVAFLANDAYNLSVLCGDTKEESKKEATARKKQEISRVFTTAYIQLIIFGAFTKLVNTKAWFTPLTSALTVLVSETTSRLRLGRPVFFLSKEKAKERNRKNKDIKETDKPQTTKKRQEKSAANSTPAKAAAEYNFNSKENMPAVFTSFKGDNKTDTTNKSNKKEEKKEQKALINFETFKKGLVILITAGFAISFLKNSSLTKNSKIIKQIKDIGNYFKTKIYNPLAFKDFEIKETEFNEIMSSLKEAGLQVKTGCKEVAEGHEFIKGKYQKVTDGVIKMYKAKLSSSGANAAIKEALAYAKELQPSLTENELKQIESSIKTAIKLEGTSISEKKFNNVAREAMKIMTKKGVNLNQETIPSLYKSISENIAKNSKEEAIQIETKLKPFVDIVTEPFKFVYSAMRLPFKLISALVGLAASPLRNKVSAAEIGEAELTKFEQTMKKILTEIYGEKFVEKQIKNKKINQIVFANAMEQLQKKTLPYREAKAALDKAITRGNSAEIEAAEKSLKKASLDLVKYVNTAVEKSFNGVTQSSNKNTDLAMMTKLASSTVTSAFLVADNYNMVMLKSDGEDKEGAKEKANERIIQRLSALFYQALFINWFNSTFKSTYNSSLLGMTKVAIPNTLTTEVLTRKSIGMPIGRKTLDELNAIDEKNENRKGFAGKYFKFMRLLTGKKPLKDRLPKDKKITNSPVTIETKKPEITNLLEIYSKK